MTSKGQVTVPKAVREALGLGPGSAVAFEMDAEGRVLVRKAGANADPLAAARPSRFARLRGSAGQGLSTDEVMALTRGE